MKWARLLKAAAEVETAAGTAALSMLAEEMSAGRSRAALLTARSAPGYAEAAAAVLDATAADGLSREAAAACLHGFAAGRAERDGGLEVSLVWSGPSSHRVPVRSTGRALLGLIAEAGEEAILMTYSARRYPPLIEALRAAVARGVGVDIVVETLQGAGSALAGEEPAGAFADVEGARLWHWPPGSRGAPGAKTHAKLAAVDRRSLLITSANFTQAGVDRNIEAGTLVKGGTAPARATEHVRELQRTGVLQRLW
ncbi:DISARM system phospholipase D-like protein DrmC [Streptomyces sp. NRRL F-5126]|uniref:DISARM system phospholipase D-like protein DrmC n=1 Tax=Streptomyces sp. NRRL F-5126 TaxID=1463857 RepID=UPI0004C5016D|nr:DISARM system phospholipase D-like protein DrmC [Streptomyces sp. NRRL F-5126]